MNFIKKIGKALDRMMDSNPALTVLGILACWIPVAIVISWVVVKAPLMAITMAGVAGVWIMVLFVNKLIEEMKR